jgi:hypothetical protein
MPYFYGRITIMIMLMVLGTWCWNIISATLPSCDPTLITGC